MNAAPVRFGPILALLYGATFWGLVWYPSRALETLGVHGAWLTLVSYGAAFVVLLPFVRCSAADLRRQPRDLLALAIAAGWTNVAFILAVLEGEVLRVLLFFYLSPIWTVLLGRWLLHEALYWRTWLMVGLGVCGALVMLWDPRIGRVPFNHADLLALSAGVAFAVNNVLTRRITSLGIKAKTQIAWLGVVVVSTGFVLVQSPAVPQVSAVAWMGTVVLGVCGFMVSTLLVVYGVTHMPVQRSSVIMLFELVIGALSAWLLAGESVSVQEWVGGVLILAAALIAIFREERPV